MQMEKQFTLAPAPATKSLAGGNIPVPALFCCPIVVGQG
jgi:hypothetical protein